MVKMYQEGISNALSWLCSYLIGRKLCVLVNGVYSFIVTLTNIRTAYRGNRQRNNVSCKEATQCTTAHNVVSHMTAADTVTGDHATCHPEGSSG